MMSCAKLTGLPDIKLKIAIQVRKTYIYPPLLCFIKYLYGFCKLIFGHQPEILYKVRKCGYNIEMHFKRFFTYLGRNSIFRTIHTSSSAYVFSKKGVLLQILKTEKLKQGVNHF